MCKTHRDCHNWVIVTHSLRDWVTDWVSFYERCWVTNFCHNIFSIAFFPTIFRHYCLPNNFFFNFSTIATHCLSPFLFYLFFSKTFFFKFLSHFFYIFVLFLHYFIIITNFILSQKICITNTFLHFVYVFLAPFFKCHNFFQNC